MKRARLLAVGVALGFAGSTVLTLNSCTSEPVRLSLAPTVPGATFVGNQACAECHATITRVFPTSAHGRLHLEATSAVGQTGCESCHGPGSLHVTSGGGTGKFIVNPGKSPSACFECHRGTEAEFHLPQHHPVLEGHMSCSQCHDPHGSDIFKPASGLAMARVNESCSECHRDQARSFVFEHQALREGCQVCHNPHGSINPKLLIQRDANLCLRCHAQIQGVGTAPNRVYIGNIDHTSYLRLGTCWSSGCHTAVHGSNVDVRLRY